MKKTLLIFLLFTVLIMQGRENFADAKVLHSSKQSYEKEQTKIEELFSARTEIWNQVYEEKTDLDQFKKEMEQIETGPILDYDISTYDSIKNSGTDMDKVLSFSILEIKDVSYGRKNMEATIKVNWKIEGLTSYYYEEVNYKVILAKSEGIWKLLDYKVTQ